MSGSLKRKDNLDRLTKQVAAGGVIVLFGSLIGKGLAYTTQIVFAKSLGAENFGIFTLGLAILNLSSLLSRLGLDIGALRFISLYERLDDRKIKGTIVQSIKISLLTGSILGFFLYFTSDDISRIIFNQIELVSTLKLFSFAVPFMSALIVCTYILAGFKKRKYFTFIREILQPILALILFLVLFLKGYKLDGAIYAWIVSIFFTLSASLYFILKSFPHFFTVKKKTETYRLMKFSIPLMVTNMFNFFILWFAILFLGIFRPTSEVGTYKIASMFSLILVLALGSLKVSFAPFISNLYNEGNLKELNLIYKAVTRWILYINLPIFITLIIFAKDIMLFTGKDYLIGWSILVVLLVSQYLNGIGGIGEQMLIMTGKNMVEFKNILVTTTLTISLNILLIPKFGMIGAAISTFISLSFLAFIRVWKIKKMYNLFPLEKKFFKGIIAGIISFLVLVTYKFLFDISFLYKLVIGLFISYITFILILKILRFEEEDVIILNMIKSRILKFEGL